MLSKVLEYVKQKPEAVVVGILTTIVGYVLILTVVVFISEHASKSKQ